MFAYLKNKICSTYTVANYRRMMKYVKPYWFRAIVAVLITIPVGAMDAVIAWNLYSVFDYSVCRVAKRL